MTNHTKKIVETANEADTADEISRRSFLRKASVAGIAATGAILGMSEEAAAQERSNRTQNASGGQAQSLQDRIVSRAATDAAYRKRLLANPTEIVRKEAGKAMPPELKIVVVEEAANTLYVVLPFIPEGGPSKLSEKDLERTPAAWPRLSWFRRCPCRYTSLSVCNNT